MLLLSLKVGNVKINFPQRQMSGGRGNDQCSFHRCLFLCRLCRDVNPIRKGTRGNIPENQITYSRHIPNKWTGTQLTKLIKCARETSHNVSERFPFSLFAPVFCTLQLSPAATNESLLHHKNEKKFIYLSSVHPLVFNKPDFFAKRFRTPFEIAYV